MEEIIFYNIEGVGSGNTRDRKGILPPLPEKLNEILYDEKWPRFIVRLDITGRADAKYYIQLNPDSGKIRIIKTSNDPVFVDDISETFSRLKNDDEYYKQWIHIIQNGDFYRLYDLQEKIKQISLEYMSLLPKR